MKEYVLYGVFAIIIILLTNEIFSFKTQRDRAILGQENIIKLQKEHRDIEKRAKEAREVVNEDIDSFNDVLDRLFD